MLDKIKNKLSHVFLSNSENIIEHSWSFMIAGAVLFLIQAVTQVPLAPGLFFLIGIYLRIMALDWTLVRGE